MKEVLVEEEGLDKQRGIVWIDRGGGSSTATPLGVFLEGMRLQRWIDRQAYWEESHNRPVHSTCSRHYLVPWKMLQREQFQGVARGT